MKKKIFSWFCALAVVMGLLSIPVSKGVVNTPCFIAVNDNLLALEDQFIPIAVGGQYYVPYTVLDSGVTGLSLGVFPIYNPTADTLAIYNREKVLVFNLTTGVCTDRSGTNYSVWLVNRNGRIYVPVRFTCEYFGLTYSTSITAYGPLVRIRSATSVLDNDSFLALAQSMMEYRLREWRRTQSPESPAVVTTPVPTPSSQTAAPPASTYTPSSPTPSLPPEPSPTGFEVDKRNVRVYLAFRADQMDGLEDVLEQLERYRIKALFFFPAQELADYDAAIYRVLCGGHAVGLLLTGTTAEETQASEGSRLLAQIAHLHTSIVLAPNADSSIQEALNNAGLLCLNPDVEALPDGRSASSQAAAVLSAVDQYPYRVTVLFDTSAEGAALTQRVLNRLLADDYNICLTVETDF